MIISDHSIPKPFISMHLTTHRHISDNAISRRISTHRTTNHDYNSDRSTHHHTSIPLVNPPLLHNTHHRHLKPASWANRAAHNLPPGQTSRSTVRTIRRLELIEEDAASGDYRLDFELDGALYRMVRNIVGGLWELGAGHTTEEELEEVTKRRDRNLNPTRSAPPEGLTLERVFYEHY